MKRCNKCGSTLDENAIFCWQCGARINEDNPNPGYGGYDPFHTTVNYAPDFRESKGVMILSFFIWQIGALLWFFWRNTRPGKAKSAAKGTMAGLSLSSPVVGLIGWLIWKDGDYKDLAKICAVSAIIGAALAATSFIVILVLRLLGVNISSEIIIPYLEDSGALFRLLI